MNRPPGPTLRLHAAAGRTPRVPRPSGWPALALPGPRQAVGLCTALLAATLQFAPGPLRAQAAVDDTVAWRCDVVYLPARSTWVRGLVMRVEDRRIAELRIDAQAVHTFAVEGTLLLTSMDNERIVIDVAEGTWTSDFRGLARGRGRCEHEPAPSRP
jgi:hypothetical protein